MPCSDGGIPYPPSREEVLNRMMPAVLCGLVAALGIETVIQAVDWKEAGVTVPAFREWWHLHQQKDELRRVREARDKRRAELRAQAEAKLSHEELEIIKERG
jgi:hypothetical protein